MSGVASPCVDVCRMNAATGRCDGCLRTLDEIAAWSSLDDDGKRAVWALLDERRRAVPGQTGEPAAHAGAVPSRAQEGRR